MALTSDQITAQNFKDFYGQIRPYLNGSVPTFANTFNKSDLYSTDEQLVGRWINGKPIYQKTFVKENISISANTTTYVTIGNYIDEIDELISSFGNRNGEEPIPYTWNSLQIMGSLDKNTKAFMLECYRSGSSFTIPKISITYQYTKSTDSAISITDGNEYSTDEQVVGHWIDGKPVYQKTFTGTTSATTSSDSVAGTIVNFDTLVNSNGTVFLAGAWGVNQHSLPYDNVIEYYIDTSNQVIIHKQNEIANTKQYMITVQYTKTTD